MKYVFFPSFWNPIIGFIGKYWINIFGQIMVFSANKKIRFLKPRKDRAGYLTVRLFRKGKAYTKYVHRLVAQSFIPWEMARPYVNHKDGKKLNNLLFNLEWVTHSENMIHAYRAGLLKKVLKPVIDNCSNREYKSAREASKYYGINYFTLKTYLNGTRSNPTCLEYKQIA
jgi:hypothetical protein